MAGASFAGLRVAATVALLGVLAVGCRQTPPEPEEYAYAGDLRLRIRHTGGMLSPSGALILSAAVENPLGGYALTVDSHSLNAWECESWPDGLRAELYDDQGTKVAWTGPAVRPETPTRGDFVQLRPGWSISSTIQFPLDDVVPEKGRARYQVRLVLEVRDDGRKFGLHGWTGTLTSNMLSFTNARLRM